MLTRVSAFGTITTFTPTSRTLRFSSVALTRSLPLSKLELGSFLANGTAKAPSCVSSGLTPVFPLVCKRSSFLKATRPLMSLVQLPQELLAHILQGDTSWAALELWKTGDRQLMSKLKSGGVRRLGLIHYRRYVRCTWPRCLKEFRLHTLSIKSVHPLLPLNLLRSELMRMNPSLRELEIEAPDAVAAFADDKPSVLRSAQASGGAFEPSKSSSSESSNRKSKTYTSSFRHRKGENETDSTESAAKRSKLEDNDSTNTLSDAWDVEKAFPALESLRLRSESENITKFKLSRFPPSLVKLHIHASPSTSIDWSALPRNMESLSFNLKVDNWKATLLQLPPNLKTLTRLPGEAQVATVLKDNPSLLPQLTELNGFASDSTGLKCVKHILWTTSSGALPPSHIESLRCLRALPSEIPQLLKNLTADGLDMNATALRTISTSLLTRLLLSNCAFNPVNFHLLPRSLEHLSIDASIIYGEPLAEEPSLLQLGAASIAKSDAEAWRIAKEELLNTHRGNSGAAAGYLSAYFERVESGGLYGLPIGLVHLSFSRIPWSNAYKLCIPPRVLNLSVGSYSESLTDPFAIAMLPPSVTVLSCTRSKRDWTLPAFSITRHLGFGMPWLQHLELDFHANATSSISELIPLLPRSLVGFTLSRDETVVPVEVLLQLPPKLTRLSLVCGGVYPSDRWLHALPRTLKALLTVRPITIHASDLLHLPPEIETLTSNVMHLSLDILYRLPRTIRLFITEAPPVADLETSGILANRDSWLYLREIFRPFWRILDAPRDEIERALATDYRANWCIVPNRG